MKTLKKSIIFDKSIILAIIFLVTFVFTGCGNNANNDPAADTGWYEDSEISESQTTVPETQQAVTGAFDYSSLPAYLDQSSVVVNDNRPYFTDEEKADAVNSFENYSDLDSLGRCGVATASVAQDIMPTEKRGEIGMVKPTGWHTVKYDNVDGKYLYNRCHLIGYQLTGENANEKNLITGTRYLNVIGMLPFENMVADYVKETGNHVLYRVTPVFVNDELVARGVLMEGFSVEDSGAGVLFNVFCYNVQPGITIDYQTGDSSESGDIDNNTTENTVSTDNKQESSAEYVLNTSSKKFHTTDCRNASSIADKNKEVTSKSRDELINEGYEPAKCCNP